MAAPDQVPGEEFEYVALFVCLFFSFDLVSLLVLLVQTAAGDLAIFSSAGQLLGLMSKKNTLSGLKKRIWKANCLRR